MKPETQKKRKSFDQLLFPFSLNTKLCICQWIRFFLSSFIRLVFCEKYRNKKLFTKSRCACSWIPFLSMQMRRIFLQLWQWLYKMRHHAATILLFSLLIIDFRWRSGPHSRGTYCTHSTLDIIQRAVIVFDSIEWMDRILCMTIRCHLSDCSV